MLPHHDCRQIHSPGAARWRRASAVALCLAVAAVAGCDDASPLVNVAEADLNARRASQPLDDLYVENRFDLDVEVQGSLKPGQPIHFTLRGRANFATEDVDIRLSLPEVAAAERSSWEDVQIPIGEETPPHIRVRREFGAGETFRERATVMIPEPGYYLVTATAKQFSDDARTDLPHMVGDVSGRSLYLWTDEHGGRLTETFDTTLFTPDVRKERGPRTPKSKPPRMRKQGPDIACVVYTHPDGSTSTCGQPPVIQPLPPTPPPSATLAVQLVYDAAAGGA